MARAESQHHFMAGYGDPAYVAEFQTAVDEFRAELTTASNQMRALLSEPAMRSLHH